MNTRGSLVIPDGFEVIFVEPAIVVEVKNETPLLLNPPLGLEDAYEVDQDITHETGNKTLRLKQRVKERYDVLFSPTINTSIIVGDTLQAEQLVLARKFEYVNPHSESDARKQISKSAFEVTTFEAANNNNPSLPESGRAVTIGKMGYVFRDAVQEHNEYYRAMDSDIFPISGGSDVSDIRQSVFGDCYLLAAIGSILATDHGSEYFNEAMFQDDQFTTVRLYSPETHQPVYLKVMNRYFCEGNDDTMTHRMPWIHMLEKAYAGYGYKETKDKKLMFRHSSFRVIYGDGGKGEHAFAILTGKKAQYVELYRNTGVSMHPWSMDHFEFPMLNEGQLDLMKAIGNEEREAVFLKMQADCFKSSSKNVHACFLEEENFRKWARFLMLLKESNPAEFAVLESKLKILDTMTGAADCHQVKQLFDYLSNELNAPADIIKLFRKYAHNPIFGENIVYRYSSSVEDACYTREQRNHYNALEKLLESNHLVTASALSKFSRPVPGLRAQHAYSLLDVKCDEIDGREHLFVKLRNPWGHVGRVYRWDQKDTPDFISESNAHAEFWLDINDFTRYFSGYTVCEPVPNLTHQYSFAQNKNRL